MPRLFVPHVALTAEATQLRTSSKASPTAGDADDAIEASLVEGCGVAAVEEDGGDAALSSPKERPERRRAGARGRKGRRRRQLRKQPTPAIGVSLGVAKSVDAAPSASSVSISSPMSASAPSPDSASFDAFSFDSESDTELEPASIMEQIKCTPKKRRASKPLNRCSSASSSNNPLKPVKLRGSALVAGSAGVSSQKQVLSLASSEEASFGAVTSSDRFRSSRKGAGGKKRPASSIASVYPRAPSSHVTTGVLSGTESPLFVANKCAKHHEDDTPSRSTHSSRPHPPGVAKPTDPLKRFAEELSRRSINSEKESPSIRNTHPMLSKMHRALQQHAKPLLQPPARSPRPAPSEQPCVSSMRHPATLFRDAVPPTPGANAEGQRPLLSAHHTHRSSAYLCAPRHQHHQPSRLSEQRTVAATAASELSPLCPLSDTRASKSIEATRSKTPPLSSIMVDGGSSTRHSRSQLARLYNIHSFRVSPFSTQISNSPSTPPRTHSDTSGVKTKDDRCATRARFNGSRTSSKHHTSTDPNNACGYPDSPPHKALLSSSVCVSSSSRSPPKSPLHVRVPQRPTTKPLTPRPAEAVTTRPKPRQLPPLSTSTSSSPENRFHQLCSTPSHSTLPIMSSSLSASARMSIPMLNRSALNSPPPSAGSEPHQRRGTPRPAGASRSSCKHRAPGDCVDVSIGCAPPELKVKLSALPAVAQMLLRSLASAVVNDGIHEGQALAQGSLPAAARVGRSPTRAIAQVAPAPTATPASSDLHRVPVFPNLPDTREPNEVPQLPPLLAAAKDAAPSIRSSSTKRSSARREVKQLPPLISKSPLSHDEDSTMSYRSRSPTPTTHPPPSPSLSPRFSPRCGDSMSVSPSRVPMKPLAERCRMRGTDDVDVDGGPDGSSTFVGATSISLSHSRSRTPISRSRSRTPVSRSCSFGRAHDSTSRSCSPCPPSQRSPSPRPPSPRPPSPRPPSPRPLSNALALPLATVPGPGSSHCSDSDAPLCQPVATPSKTLGTSKDVTKPRVDKVLNAMSGDCQMIPIPKNDALDESVAPGSSSDDDLQVPATGSPPEVPFGRLVSTTRDNKVLEMIADSASSVSHAKV